MTCVKNFYSQGFQSNRLANQPLRLSRSFLDLQVRGFHNVVLSIQKGRRVNVFQDQNKIPALGLLEPDGIELKSLRALKSRHN